MVKVIAVFLLPFLLVLNAFKCDSKGKPSTSKSPVGIYNYSGYDKSGRKIVEGRLEITSVESNRIKGKWQLRAIGSPDKIGPQRGDGELEGEINPDGLRINLNPSMNDNNVYLSGKMEGSRFHGTWSFSGFAGAINQGTFEAQRK